MRGKAARGENEINIIPAPLTVCFEGSPLVCKLSTKPEKAQFWLANRETYRDCPERNKRIQKASMNWSKRATSSRLGLWRGWGKPRIKIQGKGTPGRSRK